VIAAQRLTRVSPRTAIVNLFRRAQRGAPEQPPSPARPADLTELLRDMALRGGAPNAAAAGAAAGAAVAAGAAAAQQFWASALAHATGGGAMEEGTTVVQPFASGGYTWRIEARVPPFSFRFLGASKRHLFLRAVLTWHALQGLTLERMRSYAPGKALESPPFAVVRTPFLSFLHL
jgi:hypothetical protein